MADHGFLLWQSIEARLQSAAPVAGGWHATRLEKPNYPVGYFDLTQSVPVRGQAYYREEHEGLISVYSRQTRNGVLTPEEAFQLSYTALVALQEGVPSIAPGFEITKFSCGRMIPRQVEASWGRQFFFSAITHEVITNG